MHFKQMGKGLFWYTYVSKTKKGIGAWVYGYGTGKKLSFSLGNYNTVLQAKVYAIKVCTVDNLDSYGNVYIPSDSQAAIKAHDNYRSPQNWFGVAINPSRQSSTDTGVRSQ